MPESVHVNTVWTFWQRDAESDRGGWGHDRRVVAPQILKSVLELQEVKENVAEDETHPEPACVSTKPRADWLTWFGG